MFGPKGEGELQRLSDSERRHLRAYGHVSGLVGAATFANVFKDAVEWRTFILQFIQWWQSTIRPLLHYLFWWIEELWPWTWPEWGYDYVVLSLVFGLGGARFFSLMLPVRTRAFRLISKFSDGAPYHSQTERKAAWKLVGRLILATAFVILFWPLFLVGLLAFALLSWLNDGFSPQMREAIFLALSPVFYFGVLLILNYGLFFAEAS